MKDDQKKKCLQRVLDGIYKEMEVFRLEADKGKEEMSDDDRATYDAFLDVINSIESRINPPIRQYAWCRHTKESRAVYESDSPGAPILQDKVFTYFGEIPNMSGHCILMGQKTRMIYTGWHTDSFEEIPEDEC